MPLSGEWLFSLQRYPYFSLSRSPNLQLLATTYIEKLYDQKSNETRLVQKSLLSIKTVCYLFLLTPPKYSVWINRRQTYDELSLLSLCTECTNLVHYGFSSTDCPTLEFCSPVLSTTKLLVLSGILTSRLSSTTILHHTAENPNGSPSHTSSSDLSYRWIWDSCKLLLYLFHSGISSTRSPKSTPDL